jgi:hypothetical protein
MKYFIAFICLHITLIALASEKGISIPEVTLISSEKSEQLASNKSKFIFKIIGITEEQNNQLITYSVDGKSRSVILNDDSQFSLISSPGVHNFQFFYNDFYFEIYADSLVIKSQYISLYEIRFESSEFPVTVDKPVIYLYPEVETSFSVNVKPKGKMVFTYPTYNDAWKGTAFPNGDIKIGLETFNYLFWESEQLIKAEIINPKKGSVVRSTESISFLEEQLNLFGFNSKEKADFITYWGPKLVQNEFNYIYFVLNNDANYFAELTITPQPDNVYRFYILTCPVVNPSDYYYLEPQLIEPAFRKGFTVLEWGGSVIDIHLLKKNCRFYEI